MQFESAKKGVPHVVAECAWCHTTVASYDPKRVCWRNKHFHNRGCRSYFLQARQERIMARLRARRIREDARRLRLAIELERRHEERVRDRTICAARLAKYAMMGRRPTFATI